LNTSPAARSPGIEYRIKLDNPSMAFRIASSPDGFQQKSREGDAPPFMALGARGLLAVPSAMNRLVLLQQGTKRSL
jgi:hypothetical protein